MKSSSGPTPSTRSFAEMSPCDTLRSRPKGVTDGHHPVAHLEAVRVTETTDGQIRPFHHPEQREVGVRIASHQLGVEQPPVRQPHLDPLGVLHHVVVAHHVALRAQQEARAGRGGDAARRRCPSTGSE
jgi:hypothetical protein